VYYNEYEWLFKKKKKKYNIYSLFNMS